jgi:hypothetical protein
VCRRCRLTWCDDPNRLFTRTRLKFESPCCSQKMYICGSKLIPLGTLDLFVTTFICDGSCASSHLRTVCITDSSVGPSDRAQHLALQTPSEAAVLENFAVVGDGKGSHFMHLLPNALHLTLQARYLHCLGCHFELKQLGFPAVYRARQCLLTSRNTFISILRATRV